MMKKSNCTTAIKTKPLGIQNLSLKQGWRARRQLRNDGKFFVFSENGAKYVIESPNKPTIRDNTQKDPVDWISLDPQAT